MCLSRSGRAQHQRLEPGVEDERRDGVDQLHLQQFHRRHFRHQQPPGIALPQIHLLQILIEPALREQMPSAPASSSGSSGTCDSSAEWARPAMLGSRRSNAAGVACRPRGAGGRRASPHSCRAAARRRRHVVQRRRLARHHVPVKLRRPAHRLAGVVDDEVQPRRAWPAAPGRTPPRSACGAGRARRSPAGAPTRRNPAPPA